MVDYPKFRLQYGRRTLGWIYFLGVFLIFIVCEFIHDFFYEQIKQFSDFHIFVVEPGLESFNKYIL